VIGIDHESTRWLVPIRGSIKAHQEHVFSLLAQRLGISCQSSVYLHIPATNRPAMEDTVNEECSQLAICLIDEHPKQKCGEDCPLGEFKNSIETEDQLDQFVNSGLPHVGDFVNGDILSYLCGGAEKNDRLWTIAHEYVLIDNERMFECEANLEECWWMKFPTGEKLACEISRRLTLISDNELRAMTKLPDTYHLNTSKDYGECLIRTKQLAGTFYSNCRFRYDH
jgi:hypothetical protein